MFNWLTDTFAGIDSCFIYACVKAGLKFQQSDALKQSTDTVKISHSGQKWPLVERVTQDAHR